MSLIPTEVHGVSQTSGFWGTPLSPPWAGADTSE